MSRSISKAFSLLEKVQNFSWAKNIHPSFEKAQEISHLGSMSLLYFSASDETTKNKNIFLLPSFINRPYVLDLLPDKSFIQYLNKEGFNVYLLNWGVPNDEEKYLTFEKFFELHFDVLFNEALEHAQTEKMHLIGQCLGGTLSAIWCLLHPEKVQSLTLITTPIDFHKGAGVLQTWAQNEELNVEKFVFARGAAPWLWMQMGFLGLKPLQSVTKYRKFFQKRNDLKFVENFLALETWSYDNVSVRSQFFVNLIRDFYQENCLVETGFNFQGKKYFIQNLETPVSVLNAVDDHIVPLDSTLKDYLTTQNNFCHEWNLRGGHIGAVISQTSQKQSWPQLSQWLSEFDKTENKNHKIKISEKFQNSHSNFKASR